MWNDEWPQLWFNSAWERFWSGNAGISSCDAMMWPFFVTRKKHYPSNIICWYDAVSSQLSLPTAWEIYGSVAAHTVKNRKIGQAALRRKRIFVIAGLTYLVGHSSVNRLTSNFMQICKSWNGHNQRRHNDIDGLEELVWRMIVAELVWRMYEEWLWRMIVAQTMLTR